MQKKIKIALIGLLVLISEVITAQYYWVPFTENNLWGIWDGEGQVIFPAQFDTIIPGNTLYDYYGDHIIAGKDGKYGIVNLKGEIVLPLKYSAIYINPGLDYTHNDRTEVRTESGYISLYQTSLKQMDTPFNAPLQSNPLYYIAGRSDNQFVLFDSKFHKFFPDPVDDVLVNTMTFLDHGLLILKKNNHYGILYKWGKQFSGFNFTSAEYWINEDQQAMHKNVQVRLDNRYADFSTKGKMRYHLADLKIVEQQYEIRRIRDTRSWIYDFAVKDTCLFISDGQGYLYCYNSPGECIWARQIPDLFSNPPTLTGRNLAISNLIFNIDKIYNDPIVIPGNKIISEFISENRIYYITRTDDAEVFEETLVPGWHNLIEKAGSSDFRLACFSIDNQSLIWNRILMDFDKEQVYLNALGTYLFLSVTVEEEEPVNHVLILNAFTGDDIHDLSFRNIQKIYPGDSQIYIVDDCNPESDIFCGDISLRAYEEKTLPEPAWSLRKIHPEKLMIKDPFIFLLNPDFRIKIFNSNKGKQIKSIDLKPILDQSLADNIDDICLIGYDSGFLLILINDENLYACQIDSGAIFKYGFYSGDEWINLRNKKIDIRNGKIYILDGSDRIMIFNIL